MQPSDNAVSRNDLEHDLARLRHQGVDAVDVVVFTDIRHMGAPLALSDAARDQIFQLAVRDLHGQLAPRPARAIS